MGCRLIFHSTQSCVSSLLHVVPVKFQPLCTRSVVQYSGGCLFQLVGGSCLLPSTPCEQPWNNSLVSRVVKTVGVQIKVHMSWFMVHSHV